MKPDPFLRLVEQASCLDCYYHHRYSRCGFRAGRIKRLEQHIADQQRILDGLRDYDRAIASGWEEPPSAHERWEAKREG